jgi:hypothetical protein
MRASVLTSARCPSPRLRRTPDLRLDQNGKQLGLFEAKRLTAILNESDDIQMGRAAQAKGRIFGKTLALNRLSQPYTENGLDSLFESIKRELVNAG